MPTTTIDMKDLTPGEVNRLLGSLVAPRPIALVSTICEGKVNLSPFSYFNVFSSNPPIVGFSVLRRVRDGSTKHTLENVLQHPEAVVHVVEYDMVEQMSLSSTEYAKGINEMDKAGFQALPSDLVAPPRIDGALAAFECKVNDVIAFGDEGGAGNLVLCEVLKAHIKGTAVGSKGTIDLLDMDMISRMGGNYYCRANADTYFEIPKPLRTIGIGIDQLPEHIVHDHFWTGNDLARLANIPNLPTAEDIKTNKDKFSENDDRTSSKNRAKSLLLEGKAFEAVCLLMD